MCHQHGQAESAARTDVGAAQLAVAAAAEGRVIPSRRAMEAANAFARTIGIPEPYDTEASRSHAQADSR